MEKESPYAPDRKGDWHTFYQHLQERGDVHERSASRRGDRYKRLASLFNIVVPLLALALTITVTTSFPASHGVATVLAVVLVLFTGLNPILQPRGRYLECVEICLAIHDWRLDLELSVDAALATKLEPDRVRELLLTKNQQMSEIGRRMAGVPIGQAS